MTRAGRSGGSLRRLWRATLALLLALLAAVADGVGGFAALDRAILEWRYRVLSHGFEPGAVVVEIDSRSIEALGRWPFARRHHADLLDRLAGAGAHAIALDLDFSLASTATDDAALAAAIERRGGRVILPVFVQSDAAGGRLVENRPLPAFAQAAQLAAVNIAAERDGRIWRYPVAAELPSGFRPSMAVRLADTAQYRHAHFLIDYAFATGALRRISYVDVLEGRFDPVLVRGKPVIVGATALELGDLRAVPVAGNLPSVLVQALAYESIVRGRMLQPSGTALTWLGLAALVVVLALPRGRGPSAWKRDVARAGALAAGIVAVGLVVQAATPVALATGAWLAMVGLWLVASLAARVEMLALLLRRRRGAMIRTRALVDAIVADSFDGVLVVDAAGTVVFANPAAPQLLGVRRDAVVGRPLAEIWPAAGALVSGPPGRAQAEIAMRPSGGEERILDVVANRAIRPALDARSDAPAFQLLNFRDVTERHRARIALGIAHERAQQASRLKSQFLATMSHELRTPLNAIMGFSELIRDGRFGDDVRRYRDYAADIHLSGEHLLQVINDILDLSRIEVGQIEIRRELVDLGGVLRTCETIVRDLARRQQIALDVEVPATGEIMVVADVLRLRQIVLNLLSNAIKFTIPPGTVSLRVLVDRPGLVTIEVVDTGIGMSPEEVQIALQPFRQVDSRLERRFGGAGLGLPIAKALTELQGGTLEIVSAPGEGTRVRVTLGTARVDRAVA